MNIRNIIRHFLSIPKTVYFNFVVFPLKIAIKLPVFVSYDTKIVGMHRGCVELEKVKFRLVKLGMDFGSFERGKHCSNIINIEKNGKITFKGHTQISNGFALNISGGGVIIGNNFYANYGLLLACSNKIEIGDDCIIGWDTSIIDSDGHYIYDLNNNCLNLSKPILIENNVWVCAKVTILKGSEIAHDNIVAFSTIISGVYNKNNTVVAGCRPTVVKESISWKK